MKSKFDVLLENFQLESKIRIGVVNAADKATVQSVFNPKVKNFLDPVLIGDEKSVQAILTELNEQATVIHVDSEEDAAKKGVLLVKENKVDFLMKGHLQTSTFLKAIVNKETGIVKGGLLSHIAVNDVPTYDKLLITTDGGMVLKPTKEQKKTLILHAIEVMKKIGVNKPKVGLLAAAEGVNPKIESSVEANELKEEFMENHGDICYIDGPISLDLALSKKTAELKHYSSSVAGDADILVGPDITTMNVLGKSITILAEGKMAGVIIGAQVPIVMTSRGSSDFEKSASILLAMCCSKEE